MAGLIRAMRVEEVTAEVEAAAARAAVTEGFEVETKVLAAAEKREVPLWVVVASAGTVEAADILAAEEVAYQEVVKGAVGAEGFLVENEEGSKAMARLL